MILHGRTHTHRHPDTQAEDTEAIPGKAELVGMLGRGLEAAGGDAEASLIHGDFKIDNLVFSKAGVSVG